jgi:glycosyltransferase involved in cell wall biosynthesis
MGAEGIEVTHGENILLADDADSMARSIVEAAVPNPARRERLGRAGRSLAEQHYDWRVIGERLERVYEEGGGGTAVWPAITTSVRSP